MGRGCWCWRGLQDCACAGGARQHLHSQGQAPAAGWRGTQLQIDVLIMDNELLMNGEAGWGGLF